MKKIPDRRNFRREFNLLTRKIVELGSAKVASLGFSKKKNVFNRVCSSS